MRKITFSILLFSFILLAGGIVALVKTFSTYHQVLEYDVSLNIVSEQQHAGLNVENDKIYFGTLSVGDSSARQIKLKNTLKVPTRVLFEAKGAAGKYVVVPDNGYLLKSGEERIFMVEARPPITVSVGNYTGKLIIYFLKV